MAEDEAPDWIGTPDECSYLLTMYDSGGGSVQSIEISREEYIAMKEHLGALRGYTKVDLTEALGAIAGKECDSGDNCYFPRNAQQVSHEILVARSIYRACPEAVIANDDGFRSKLRELSEESVPDYRING